MLRCFDRSFHASQSCDRAVDCKIVAAMDSVFATRSTATRCLTVERLFAVAGAHETCRVACTKCCNHANLLAQIEL